MKVSLPCQVRFYLDGITGILVHRRNNPAVVYLRKLGTICVSKTFLEQN